MTQIAFPFRISASGVTATATTDDHVRQMVEQVLFTSPCERVNRPDFGCGLLTFPFEPAGLERLAVLEALIRANLEQWLGDVILLGDMGVSVEECTVRVVVSYDVRRTGRRVDDVFQWRTSP
jgi:phage baseplate assembly protein W